MSETVIIDGHAVDSKLVDQFYNGSDGSRVSDEQWDESKHRTAFSEEDLLKLGFDFVGSDLPEGHSTDGGE